MSMSQKINKLSEMGFERDACKEALDKYDGDEKLALNFLLG